MKTIHVLSPLLVNQIAAGECIERPASVVKELVENSLDAHATNVEVYVEEAGVRLIRIEDNGKGISQEDLPLALTSHATSKLSSSEDLFSINTLGFRGEALASIAAVSEVRISSCLPGEMGGYKLVCRQGEMEETKPVAMNPGTIVEVHDLFFNIPARRKFLKKRNVEMGHITDNLTRLAISVPQVGFKLMHNNRLVFAVEKTDDAKVRVEDLLNVVNVPILVAQENNPRCRLTAYLAAPEMHRSNSKHIYFYVNHRSVKDKTALRALSDAYQDYLPPRRYPIAVVYLEVDSAEVDVNVHPAKTEVRYRDGSLVYSIVRNAAMKALSSAELAPEIPIISNSQKEHRIMGNVDQKSFLPDLPQTSEVSVIREETSEYKTSSFEPNPSEEISQQQTFYPTVDASSTVTSNEERVVAENEVKETFAMPQVAGEEESRDARCLQIHNSYLVIESEEGVEIVDQHALHERILYSRLRKQIQSSQVVSQLLLFPITLNLSGKEMAIFQEWHETLQKVGIEAESFGPNSIIVRSLPQVLGNVCEAELVHDILQKLGEQERVALDEIMDPIIATMACKAAIKAGDRLNQVEMESLLRKKKEADNPFHCPHGRPTTLKITLRELEKHFKRR